MCWYHERGDRIRAKWQNSSLKPLFLHPSCWLPPHSLVLLIPAPCLQLNSLCHPPTAFLTPSEQLPSPAPRFPGLSPRSHPWGRTPAPLLPPHPLTPHLCLCLLLSCSPGYASPQQDPSFQALSFPLPVSLFHLKSGAAFPWGFIACVGSCLQRSKWLNTVPWVSLCVQHTPGTWMSFLPPFWRVPSGQKPTWKQENTRSRTADSH